MRKVISLDEFEEPVRRFLEGLEVSPEASVVEVDGKQVYLVVRSTEASALAHEPWSGTKNRRRYELVDKEIASTITPTEAVELEELTQAMRRHRDQVAPLPFEYVRQLYGQLLDQVNDMKEKGINEPK